MPQTFEDLAVEKEVAVRRRMAKESIFFLRLHIIYAWLCIIDSISVERTFQTFVHTMTIWRKSRIWVRITPFWFFAFLIYTIAFNLINEIDVAKTEARINAYRAENAALIELNIQREETYARELREQEDTERRERELRATQLRQEEEEEREEREKERKEIIDKLETSDKSAAKVIAKSRANALKRSSARAAAASASVVQSSAKLLRTRAAMDVPDVPHVPFQDNWYSYEDKFSVNPKGYDDFFSEAVRKDKEGIMRGGGYMVEETWRRALTYAVAALDLPQSIGLPSSTIDSSGDVVMASV